VLVRTEELEGGQPIVSKPKDPLEVVTTIRESIEASPRKSRKVLFHNLRGKFGWQVWTVQRRELVTQLLKDQEILAQPSIADAGSDDWIMLSMPIIDRETFDRIKEKHGPYASWAVWAEPDGKPKSHMGDLTVLDPDQNPALLGMLRSDVVMLGLNLSRDWPPPFGNFHDARPEGQDYKIRFAFTGTPFYGAYMTDIIKGVVMLKSGDLMRYLAANPDVVAESVGCLLEEFDDLKSESPTVIAFGGSAHLLAAKHLPANRYARLVRVTHYADYISPTAYRERVLRELSTEGLR
jgi:hypothetical protein